MNKQEVSINNRLRQIHITARPESRFPVPISDGYSVYSALLGVLEAVDADVSGHIHDSSLGSLHSSGLRGVFGDSNRAYHKLLLPDETYQLTLGVVDPADTEIFQALVNALVLEGDRIELSHGELHVEQFESLNTTQAELLDEAGSMDNPTIEMSFETATCIEEADEITTMFPHRGAVFLSLLGKWNRSVPEELELDLRREAIEANVIEKPDARTYDTHSVLVNRVKNEDGETRNLFRQGFTGDCAYEFKGASESVENAVTALGMFAEYSGVGSAVARGCGQVNSEVKD
ncbi:CRISPR system precrRNA processing endoribonuclease RAMP protein Cas6 [Haloarcula sp. Atlit-120R]|nr:CRISPR system precrRNA processing endoribonuclease RAMP protein Cas6 [Haloarcula sp. Atlit-120R]